MEKIDEDELYDLFNRLDNLVHTKISDISVEDLSVINAVRRNWFAFIDIYYENRWTWAVYTIMDGHMDEIIGEEFLCEEAYKDYTVIDLYDWDAGNENE